MNPEQWIGWIEKHPLAVLVLLLIMAVVQLWRMLDKVRKEKWVLTRELFRAKAGGYEMDEDTTQIIEKRKRRASVTKERRGKAG